MTDIVPGFGPVEDLPPTHDDFQAPNHRVDETPLAKWRREKREEKAAKNPRATKPKKPAPAYVEGMFIEPLEEMYMTAAAMVLPFKPAIFQYLTTPERILRIDEETKQSEWVEGHTGAQKCAIAWDNAARKSESVRRFLDGITTASVWGALVTAHMPILMALFESQIDRLLDRSGPKGFDIGQFMAGGAQEPPTE